MNNAPKNEKWLIFVNSVRDGKDYLEKIKLFTNKKAKLLLEQFYLGLKNSYKLNPDFYLMHIRQWLRTEKKINHIFSEDCDNLISFLEHFKNTPISEQDTEEFYKAFQYYYKRYCVEKFKDNSEILEKALNIRKGKTQRKSTINKSLEIIELPYKLNKHNRSWIIS